MVCIFPQKSSYDKDFTIETCKTWNIGGVYLLACDWLRRCAVYEGLCSLWFSHHSHHCVTYSHVNCSPLGAFGMFLGIFWKAILGKLPIHLPPLLNLKCGNHTLWHFLVIFCSQSPNWGRKVVQVSEVTELKLQNIVPLNNFKIWWDPLTQGVCVQTFNLIIFSGVFLFLLL